MARMSRSETVLTQDLIAKAALDILDRAEEPGELSFRRLAAELNRSHMTVHRACGDFAGLLDTCVDHLAAELPEVSADADWADGTERRLTGLYRLMVRYPGLTVLRRGRPWVGPEVLRRLVEPQLAANRAAGMTAVEAIRAYRRMYLYTLGCAAFVDHADPEAGAARTRVAVAALPPREVPTLSGDLDAVIAAMSDHEVYRGGLRQLISAADPRTG